MDNDLHHGHRPPRPDPVGKSFRTKRAKSNGPYRENKQGQEMNENQEGNIICDMRFGLYLVRMEHFHVFHRIWA